MERTLPRYPCPRRRTPLSAALLLASLLLSPGSAALRAQNEGEEERPDLLLVADQAEAVLAILERQRAQQAVTEADWLRVLSSEGYKRLKRREESLGRTFTDEAFRAFLVTPELVERAGALRDTLARWRRADLASAVERARRYLPREARIRAKIYPVIKPQDNSFVFDLDNDPAVFLYLDPAVTAEKFENTVAHELHHIGFGTACPPRSIRSRYERRPVPVRSALRWLGALGEGFAMLAAAGGPGVHPHAVSPAAERERWDQDLERVGADLQVLEGFFVDVLDGRLPGEAETERAQSFYGIQGPWYTVGWKMAATIEEVFGRKRLIQSFCEPATLLSTYNQAADEKRRSGGEVLVTWTEALVRRIEAEEKGR